MPLRTPRPSSSRLALSPCKPFHVSRRTFLQKCALAAAASGLPAWFLERDLAAAEAVPANSSPNDGPGIALIGCGGQGTGDATNASSYGRIVAICDVDEQHVAAGIKQF